MTLGEAIPPSNFMKTINEQQILLINTPDAHCGPTHVMSMKRPSSILSNRLILPNVAINDRSHSKGQARDKEVHSSSTIRKGELKS